MKRFKPVGGGYLQRCGQAVKASSSSELLGAPGLLHTPSLLAKNLNRQVLWGHMTVSNVASIASDAVTDGLLHTDLRQLAKRDQRGKLATPGGITNDIILHRLWPRQWGRSVL